MKSTYLSSAVVVALAFSSSALAQSSGDPNDKKTVTPPAAGQPVDKTGGKEAPKEPEKDGAKASAAPKPKAKPVTCELLTKEAPRGGRLEVQGQELGKSPVVKIGGVVTRIIEHPGDKIAVQIPKKSNGGAVVVRVDGNDVACGTLTIIGLD